MEDLFGFALLQLPMLAIKDILNMMTAFELLNICDISKRGTKLVQLYTGPQRFNIDFYANGELKIFIDGTEMTYQFRRTVNKEDHGKTRFYVPENDQITEEKLFYAEDPIGEQMKIFDRVKECLRCNIKNLLVSFSRYRDRNREMTDWLAPLASTFKDVSIFGMNPPKDDVNFFIEQIGVQKTLRFELTTKIPPKIPKVLEYLTIPNGQWLSLEDFMQIDCPDMWINHSELTNQDLNKFLKSWKLSECHRNTRHIVISVKRLEDFDEIFEGVEHKDPDPIRAFELSKNKTFVNAGVDIKRDDGAIANVFPLRRDDTNFFRMRVFRK